MTKSLVYILTVLIFLGCKHHQDFAKNFLDVRESEYLETLRNDLDNIIDWQSRINDTDLPDKLSDRLLAESTSNWILLRITADYEMKDQTIAFIEGYDGTWEVYCNQSYSRMSDKSSNAVNLLLQSITEEPFMYDLSLEALHNEFYYMVFSKNKGLKRRVIVNPSNSAYNFLKLGENYRHLSELSAQVENIAFQNSKCK